MSEHQTLKHKETPAPDFGDPVLVSRTATDYLPHEKDQYAYVGSYQPKYLLVIWAMYLVWASWYAINHYIPDIKNWFGPKPEAVIYGNYPSSYWDLHVHYATVEEYVEKTNLKDIIKKKLAGEPAQEAAPAAGGDAAASGGGAPAAAAPASGGEGMSFPGAGDLTDIKSTTAPITPDDLK